MPASYIMELSAALDGFQIPARGPQDEGGRTMVY